MDERTKHSKWPIQSERVLPDGVRKQYWESLHLDGYSNVLSLTEDPAIRRVLLDRIGGVEPLERMLVPGAGSVTALQESILNHFPRVEIVSTDYERVIELAQQDLSDPRATFLALDSREVAGLGPFDAALIVNAVVSESDQENRAILRATAQSLRPSGKLIGIFPTVFASLDIATISGDKRRLAKIDLERSTYYEEAQDAYQIFYTPLRLRVMLKECGLVLQEMSVLFLDSAFFLKTGKDTVEFTIEDDDLIVYELLIVASKS